MPDTPDAAPEPAPGGSPAEQPLPIHALPAVAGNGAASVAGEPAVAPDQEPDAASRWSLSNISWPRLVIAVLVVVAGAVASVLGARAVARSDAESSRKSFAHASAGTAGAVKLALAHQDGVLTAS